jgi:hypothetical protein
MADEIEVRGFADGRPGVDEVVHRIDGTCVFHLESMNDTTYWFACYLPDGRRVSANLFVADDGTLKCEVQDDERTAKGA